MSNPSRLLGPRRVETDSFELALDDSRMIEVRRVRDPRARRIKLSVDERGARLSLPVRASVVAGVRFVEQHRDWLARQLAGYAREALPPLLRGGTGALPLRGAMVPLAWRDGRYTQLQRLGEHDRDGLAFTATPLAGAPAIRRALHEFYEAQARADIGRWLPRYLSGLPKPPRRVRLKVMSSQWGSLAPDGPMTLDLALVLARPSAFEYVLVHELCHLVHANHSRAFWYEVEARCPHWRDERDWFRAEGRRIKAMLRALLA